MFTTFFSLSANHLVLVLFVEIIWNNFLLSVTCLSLLTFEIFEPCKLAIFCERCQHHLWFWILKYKMHSGSTLAGSSQKITCSSRTNHAICASTLDEFSWRVLALSTLLIWADILFIRKNWVFQETLKGNISAALFTTHQYPYQRRVLALIHHS